MKTETLIHKLATECQPVKPLGSPTVRFLKWFMLTSVMLSAGVLIWRPDLNPNVFFNPSFMYPAAVMVGVSLVCALSAFILTIPDEKSLKLDFMLGIMLVFWFGLIAYLFLAADLSNTGYGFFCVSRTIILSALPIVLLFYMLKKAAPIKSGTVGLLASLSVLSFASMGVQFVCQKAWPAHILVWHLLPVCILSGLGFFLGRLIFKWNLISKTPNFSNSDRGRGRK